MILCGLQGLPVANKYQIAIGKSIGVLDSGISLHVQIISSCHSLLGSDLMEFNGIN